uniref:Uncharacterized protein n=1 Tax=Anguilla anguilla TaxID=7936 RepID=A0A0E9QKW3_ANGAN
MYSHFDTVLMGFLSSDLCHCVF